MQWNALAQNVYRHVILLSCKNCPEPACTSLGCESQSQQKQNIRYDWWTLSLRVSGRQFVLHSKQTCTQYFHKASKASKMSQGCVMINVHAKTPLCGMHCKTSEADLTDVARALNLLPLLFKRKKVPKMFRLLGACSNRRCHHSIKRAWI